MPHRLRVIKLYSLDPVNHHRLRLDLNKHWLSLLVQRAVMPVVVHHTHHFRTLHWSVLHSVLRLLHVVPPENRRRIAAHCWASAAVQSAPWLQSVLP
jgi:hypothetical protein